jgi:hypothetical protein
MSSKKRELLMTDRTAADRQIHPPPRHLNRRRWLATLGTQHTRVSDTDPVQRLLHPLHHAVGIIAVIAEMPEHHVMQAGMRDGFKQLGGLVVREMPVM